eukprot:gnl/Dysnectes_brevis/5591_a8109_581.p1 GENE.gnl/Dysnectes_brevis/5591_a8109_581~~gnl/Dysnectes_brevis/5591_a8109_581.p1  ORF type:complete len:496 (+),score=29.92 gnl/Dysnectes_brevis/5591_a8109_581:84-1490(+)
MSKLSLLIPAIKHSRDSEIANLLDLHDQAFKTQFKPIKSHPQWTPVITAFCKAASLIHVPNWSGAFKELSKAIESFPKVLRSFTPPPVRSFIAVAHYAMYTAIQASQATGGGDECSDTMDSLLIVLRPLNRVLIRLPHSPDIKYARDTLSNILAFMAFRSGRQETMPAPDTVHGQSGVLALAEDTPTACSTLYYQGRITALKSGAGSSGTIGMLMAALLINSSVNNRPIILRHLAPHLMAVGSFPADPSTYPSPFDALAASALRGDVPTWDALVEKHQLQLLRDGTYAAVAAARVYAEAAALRGACLAWCRSNPTRSNVPLSGIREHLSQMWGSGPAGELELEPMIVRCLRPRHRLIRAYAVLFPQPQVEEPLIILSKKDPFPFTHAPSQLPTALPYMAQLPCGSVGMWSRIRGCLIASLTSSTVCSPRLAMDVLKQPLSNGFVGPDEELKHALSAAGYSDLASRIIL